MSILNTNFLSRKKESGLLLLFFLHNFFISLGTILVYVAANLLLLEHNPETSLPIAYIIATFVMLAVGRIYENYEHHIVLRKLSTRVIFVVVLVSVLMVIALLFNHTIAIAIGIMVGFRVIYLLVNLEFWGVSALVFDVRQSKRFFSVIGSGDVPAKAIGAILTVLINSTDSIYLLVILASFTFLIAFYTQNLTFKTAQIPSQNDAKIRTPEKKQSKIIEQLFGGSDLVFQMCMSLVAIAAAGTLIEYNFFINVKYKFHDQHSVISFVGYLLAITYAISTFIKLLLSSRVIDRFGLKNALLLLPVGTFLLSIILTFFSFKSDNETSLLLDFSAAYLCFEVFRRTVFDPVFLVLFQPLSVHQRLKGHTLAKGFYEPIGMGLAGILLISIYFFKNFDVRMMFCLTATFAGFAIFFLNRTYFSYLIELKTALGNRFLHSETLLVKGDAFKIILKNIKSDKPVDVLNTIDWIEHHKPDLLNNYVFDLLKNPSEKVRLRILQAITRLKIVPDIHKLFDILSTENDDNNQQLMAIIIAANNKESFTKLLTINDLNIIQGAIIGGWKHQENQALAKKRLDELCESKDTESLLLALETIEILKLKNYENFIKNCLTNEAHFVKLQAVKVTGNLKLTSLAKNIASLIHENLMEKQAINSLFQLENEGVTEIKKILIIKDKKLLKKVIYFGERTQNQASQDLLVQLANHKQLDMRLLALKALTAHTSNDNHHHLVNDLLKFELTHAHYLLNGLEKINNANFDNQIHYEIGETTERIFYLLMLLHDKEIVQSAMKGVENASRERRANALEILDNIIPRPLYKCLHALLDDIEPIEKIAFFDKYFTDKLPKKHIIAYILENGDNYFGLWTLVSAIRHWQPNVNENKLFEPYFANTLALIQEAIAELKTRNENYFQKYFNQFNMSHQTRVKNAISELERVIVLKNTELFENTPENVLTSFASIMKEAVYKEGQEVFKKGDIGNCMFLIFSGTMGIYDHETLLAELSKGEVVGELALLDSGTRSASVIAETDCLVFRIDQEDFYDLMEERSELLRSVMKILCHRIRVQNEKWRAMKTAEPLI